MVRSVLALTFVALVIPAANAAEIVAGQPICSDRRITVRVEGPSNGIISLQALAHAKWEAKVRDKLGNAYAVWAVSVDRKERCEGSPCKVSARACANMIF